MATWENTDAIAKLKELLHCGNERVELSAAKELLALAEEQNGDTEAEPEAFAVEIRVVESDG